ncbi:MAG: DUF6478 family protein [Rubricella sp.]
MRGPGFILATLVHRLVLGVWRRRAREAEGADGVTLRRWRRQARTLQPLIDTVRHHADRRLAPGADPATAVPVESGDDGELLLRPAAFFAPDLPLGIAAPESGTRFGQDLSIHHDLDRADLILRRLRVPSDPRSYRLRLEGFAIAGEFVSLVLTLPEEMAGRIAREDLVAVSVDIETDAPIDLYARLNLRHGPNTEKIVRRIDLAGGETSVEFDVFYTDFDPARAAGAWVDLIFEPPTMRAIDLRDVAIWRKPRLSL